MAIITPAYPSMNSTFNVRDATLRILGDEWARGRDCCARVLAGGADWDQLFVPLNFFQMCVVSVRVCARWGLWPLIDGA